jgi:hypothetical protein
MCLGKAGGYEKHRGRSLREKKKYGFTASMRYEKSKPTKTPANRSSCASGHRQLLCDLRLRQKANPEESTCEERSVGYVRAAAALSSRKRNMWLYHKHAHRKGRVCVPLLPMQKKGFELIMPLHLLLIDCSLHSRSDWRAAGPRHTESKPTNTTADGYSLASGR